MRLLDVDEQRPRAGIAAARDRIIGRRDAVDRRAFELARILFQIRIAEDAERVGTGLELLDDQIVVLTRIDIGAVLAHRLAALVERVRIERLGAGVGFLAALGENQRSEEHTSELQSLMRISYAV